MENFYIVGDKKFNNIILAIDNAARNNSEVKFCLFDSAFDNADWSREPSLSWDQLLDIRVNQIASMNKKIILAFSGGTDSLTIYHTMIRNGIIPDYIHLRTRPKEQFEQFYFFDPAISFLKNEKQQFKFEIILTHDSSQTVDSVYDSDHWFLKDGARLKFTTGLWSSIFEEIDQNLPNIPNQEYVYVTGLEKPYCKYRNGSFYSSQYDSDWNQIQDDRIEPFFISPALPELHIKQSYMVAQYAINESQKLEKPVEFFKDFRDTTKIDYYKYATIGCGRSGDIANSALQKYKNINSALRFTNNTLSSIDYAKSTPPVLLQEGIASNSNFAKRFLNGLKILSSDFILLDKHNSYNIKQFKSKEYKLSIDFQPR